MNIGGNIGNWLMWLAKWGLLIIALIVIVSIGIGWLFWSGGIDEGDSFSTTERLQPYEITESDEGPTRYTYRLPEYEKE